MKKTLKNLLLTLSLCSNALLAGAQQEVFNQEDISEKLRDRFIRQLKKEKRSECDANTYTYWDEVDKRFKLNELSIIADEYETRVQYSIYHDGTYVLRNIEEQNTFTVKDRGCWAVSEQVKNIVVKTTFADKRTIGAVRRIREKLFLQHLQFQG